MNDKNLERAAALDTATLSDALDKLGIAGQCLGIKPRDHRFRMTGRAYTVLYGPIDTANPARSEITSTISSPGTVVVLDNGGREDATVWGDILTWLAHHKGLAGTVIDGANRDTHLSLELGYPIFSRSYSMRTGKDRVQVDASRCRSPSARRACCQGDLLRGDADGVVVIPKTREEEVLESPKASTAPRRRSASTSPPASGWTKRESLLKYHSLQTKKECLRHAADAACATQPPDAS